MLLIYLIRFYQLFISPFMGRHCRFEPTCSHYAIQAIKQHGYLKGVALSIKRVLCCHPWHAGG